MRTVAQREMGNIRDLPSSSRDENSGSATLQMKIRERARAVRDNGRGRARQAMTLAYPGLTRIQLPTASSRPLRPSALPAPRPRIAVLYSLPCRRREKSPQLGIHDARDAIDGVVMLADRKREQFVNDDACQINGAAFEGAIP